MLKTTKRHKIRRQLIDKNAVPQNCQMNPATGKPVEKIGRH